MAEWPEDLFTGADEPRPLPPALRASLEDALLGRTTPRPVPTGTRRDLEDALTDGGARRVRWLAAAAAAVLLAGGLAAGLVVGTGGHSAPRLAAHPPAASEGSTSAGAGGSAGTGSNDATGTSSGAGTSGQGPEAAAPLAAPGAPSGGFSATAGEMPTITGLSPSSGPARGGTTVVISGQDLAAVSAVSFGGVPAAFSHEADGTLRATTPPHGAGTVDVVVSSASGPSTATAADRFSYR